jgi:hypothetical protein
MGVALAAGFFGLAAVPSAASITATTGSIHGVIKQPSSSGPVALAGACAVAFNTTTTADVTSAPTTLTTTVPGSYVIAKLPFGSYKVFFFSCSGGNHTPATYHNPAPDLQGVDTTNGTTLTLSSSTPKLTGIGAVLQRGTAISGTITDASTGANLGGICPIVRFAPGQVQAAIGSSSDPTSGAYTIHGVPVGTNLIVNFFDCSGTGYQTQWWNAQTTEAAADTFTLTLGHPGTGFNAAMAPAAAAAASVVQPRSASFTSGDLTITR